MHFLAAPTKIEGDGRCERLEDVEAAVILGYLIHLRTRNLKATTRARHLVTLRGLFRFLHQEKAIP